jgi:hypothetical protein
MNAKFLTVGLLIATLPLCAMASDEDCYPDCAESAPFNVNQVAAIDAKLDTVAVVARRESTDKNAVSGTCGTGLLKRADALNEQAKPLREVVGYVRSPQGLVVKLVNDHVVKIPSWVGYAIDPLGSLKSKAIDEAKSHVRDAFNKGTPCDTKSGDVESIDGDSAEAINEKHSI